ncbi:hypothetical protein CVT26_006160 [Gymnopilus dilepis]|uniref:Uncharacterized protein n=1 Tax=Gymnopilus dilepis TaxID=231916 RepID=A0A409WGA1_9AGAR|nr:hypothetical protein CVT26_006160 [Gymnopilus dilepis]
MSNAKERAERRLYYSNDMFTITPSQEILSLNGKKEESVQNGKPRQPMNANNVKKDNAWRKRVIGPLTAYSFGSKLGNIVRNFTTEVLPCSKDAKWQKAHEEDELEYAQLMGVDE